MTNKTNRNKTIQNKKLQSRRKNNTVKKATTGGVLKLIDTKKDYNTFYFENITNQENTDNQYKEVGLVNIINSQPINILRSLMSKSSSVIGRKGYELSIYNYAINDLMKNVKDEMVKQSIDKISNARISARI